MDSFIVCINAILPIFLIIAAGYGSKRAGWIGEKDVDRFNAVVFRAFMPVMCFYNIYGSDLSSAVQPRLLLYTFVCILLTFALAVLYASLRIPERRQRGVVIQGIFRSNYLILGLPVTANLIEGADLGVAAVVGAVAVPTFNMLAVIILDIYSGKKISVPKLLLDVLKNPLIIGTALGVLALVSGVHLPKALDKFALNMAQVASPMMLFLLGAFFRFDSFRGQGRLLTAVCLARLVLVPAAALCGAVALGYRGVELATLMSVFGSSTAVASFTMAQQMGGDARLAGNIVVTTSLLCALTFFAWSFLFKSLGYF